MKGGFVKAMTSTSLIKKVRIYLLATVLIASYISLFSHRAEAVSDSVAYTSEDAFEVEYENGYAYIISYNGSDTDVIVPPSFSSYTLDGICERAFYKSRIKSVVLPSVLSQVANETFAECAELTSVKFADAKLDIGKGAFRACTSLTSITLPSVSEISDFTFFGCTSLSSIELPPTLEKIGMRAFYGCAFEEISIPASVNYIGKYAFSGCTRLKNVSVSEENTSYDVKPPVLISGNEVVYMPEGIDGEYTIDNVTTVRRNAFYGTSLSKLVISDSVTELCDRAFYGSSSLQSIIVPENVTKFGYDIFGKCENLTVYCYADSAALSYVKENGISYEIIQKIYVAGDVNGDGKINTTDLLLLDAYIHQKTVDLYLQPADVNGDEEIDISDIIKLAEMIKNSSSGA